MDVGLT